MSNHKKPTIEFAPGCFDQFEGSQEELDDLISKLIQLVESGELMENSIILDEDDELSEQLLLSRSQTIQ